MVDRAETSLLPNGLRDKLPPEAAHEAAVMERLLASFRTYGYTRVDPPLVEFEDNLLAGVGTAMGPHTFRLMDPVSQRMMGVRADMTPQVARIAATRLSKSPRPLRLAYGGSVLRVRGTQLRPERQFRQAGCELIGVDTPGADAEALILAAVSLEGIGVKGLSIDITLPALVRDICEASALDAESALAALDHKDAAAVAALGGEAARIFGALLNASGPAETAMPRLTAVDLPARARREVARLKDVLNLVAAARPDLTITIDPVENRGFAYQDGLSFTIFARGVRGELGRGGRYNSSGDGEPGMGFTLYLDTIIRAVPDAVAEKRVFLPIGTAPETARQLRRDGWIAIAALEETPDLRVEAARLGCTHILEGDAPVALDHLAYSPTQKR